MCLPTPVYCLQKVVFWHFLQENVMEWETGVRTNGLQLGTGMLIPRVGFLCSDWVKSTAGLATLTQRATCEKSAADLRKYRFILLSSTELIIISSCKHNINHQKFNRGTVSSGMLMLKQKNTTMWCPKHITQYTSFPNLHSYFLISDFTCLKLSIHFHMQTSTLQQLHFCSVIKNKTTA